MNNRITQLFERKGTEILSVFFTAGYPELNQTAEIIETLVANGVDMIEIGIPYSDPIADGPTIQHSSEVALKNGMSVHHLFEQLADIRERVDIPLLLMGYLNPVLQYGIEAFCQKAAETGIDGLILPDLPMYEYEAIYRPLFLKNSLSNIFLVTPQTSESRIRKIDELSNGFIYLVSTDSTTGKTSGISETQKAYFERIQGMNLTNPSLIGFGISDRASFLTTTHYAQGAIIGSAFIKALGGSGKLPDRIGQFCRSILSESIPSS